MTESAGVPLELNRGLLSDQVYDYLKRSIREGDFPPGTQLVESQLARQLGVSQAPVREAVKRLTHEGVVTHVSHRGSFVTTYSEEEAEQARVARVVLEALAGELACGRIDERTRSTLQAAVDRMFDAAERNDVAAFRDLDLLFHRTVIAASGNVYLPRMWEQIEPSLRSLHVLSDPKFTGDWRTVALAHQRLLELLDSGTPQEAAELFRTHATGGSLAKVEAAPPARQGDDR